MISDLFDGEVDGQKLSDEDVAQFSMALLVAGIETTQRLIANLVYALCRFPEQMAALRHDPALLPAAIEEALRYFPPNQFRMRVAVADTELGGVAIPGGSVLYALTGSANRDPRAFERPDDFDITRQPGECKHVSFGHGPHHCIGAHLARLETFHAVSSLLDNTRDLRLDAARVPKLSGFRNRSPESLWLQFSVD
jgi:cytochrome P450